eukprot:756409-Hanusia_phi.AAC.3
MRPLTQALDLTRRRSPPSPPQEESCPVQGSAPPTSPSFLPPLSLPLPSSLFPYVHQERKRAAMRKLGLLPPEVLRAFCAVGLTSVRGSGGHLSEHESCL